MQKRSIITILLGIVALLMTGWFVFPFMKPLPCPTGPYKLGTETLELTDNSRQEMYAPNNKRTVRIHMIYPAETANKKPMSYLGDKLAALRHIFAQHHGLPLWLSKVALPQLSTHLYPNAPIKLGKYPVILFSHGLLGMPSDAYLSILENITSHGYIVCAIDHPYFNVLTQSKDGKTVSSQELSKQFTCMSPQEQKDFQATSIDSYKADMGFVLDKLAKINQDPQNKFYQKLALNHVAVIGHSAGGTAAIEFCRTDHRCKAAINLDGWYDHIIKPEPLSAPLLLMFGEKSIEVGEPDPAYLKRKDITREQYFERERNIAEHRKALCSSPLCTFEIIKDAAHEDFSDAILFKWPLRAWRAAPSYQTLAEINSKIIEFLNKALLASAH